MSLSTLVYHRRRSAAASLRSVRNPWFIQAESEPPGRHPPAPGSHDRRTRSVTGGPFVGLGWGETFLSSRRFPLHLFRPYGSRTHVVGL